MRRCPVPENGSAKRLQEGTALEDLRELQAPPELLRAVKRAEEFRQWQQEYLPS
jgi:hypothetical protein